MLQMTMRLLLKNCLISAILLRFKSLSFEVTKRIIVREDASVVVGIAIVGGVVVGVVVVMDGVLTAFGWLLLA